MVVAGGNNSHGHSTAESDDDEDDEVGADGSTMYDDAMMVVANNDCGRGSRCPMPKPPPLASRGLLPFPQSLNLSQRRWLEGRTEAHRALHECRAKIII
jgi:hypothetical protein